MAETRKVLSKQLRTLREVRGYSQKGLATAAGVSFRAIQNAEQGLSDLGADTLVPIADALGVTIDALLRDADGAKKVISLDPKNELLGRLIALLSPLDFQDLRGALDCVVGYLAPIKKKERSENKKQTG